jgi:hypothetical protein
LAVAFGDDATWLVDAPSAEDVPSLLRRVLRLDRFRKIGTSSIAVKTG